MNVFESNRETLLRVLGVPSSQIQEEDVQIESLDILGADSTRTSIDAQSTNMFGRFFIQFVAQLTCSASKPTEFNWTQKHDALTQLVFAENWHNRKKGRKMLIALGTAVRIENIVWKP